jgi:hypothetical protein
LANEYWDCLVGGASGATEPVPSNATAGSTFTDGAVTWKIVTLPTTESSGDWGEYSSAAGASTSAGWNIQVSRVNDYTSGNVAAVDNLHMRALGSAAGWLVKGVNKNTTAGVLSQSFAAGDLTLARDGIFLNSTTAMLGAFVRTTKNKGLVFRRHFGAYTISRGHLQPFGLDLKKMIALTAAQAYHRRIQSSFVSNAASEYGEPADQNGTGPATDFYVSDEVPLVFCGLVKGSTGTPITCTLSGFSVTETPHRIRSAQRSEPIQLFSLGGGDQSFRASLGIPTSGFFMSLGEYIHNASATDGAAVKGWRVKTAGILCPDWVTGVVVVKQTARLRLALFLQVLLVISWMLRQRLLWLGMWRLGIIWDPLRY